MAGSLPGLQLYQCPAIILRRYKSTGTGKLSSQHCRPFASPSEPSNPNCLYCSLYLFTHFSCKDASNWPITSTSWQLTSATFLTVGPPVEGGRLIPRLPPLTALGACPPPPHSGPSRWRPGPGNSRISRDQKEKGAVPAPHTLPLSKTPVLPYLRHYYLISLLASRQSATLTSY